MADRHPYSPGPGGVTTAIGQFQKSFPKQITGETLKKLAIAPKNESYVINILRFIGVIDAEGNKTELAAKVFSKSGEDFQKDFEGVVKNAYSDLFALHDDAAWGLSRDKLKAFFRHSDQTSDLVGGLQAATFQVLASFAGHQVPTPVPQKVGAKSTTPKTKITPKKVTASVVLGENNGGPSRHTDAGRDFALTVRVEVNLPSDGDQETYDRIFRSIRENLLSGK